MLKKTVIALYDDFASANDAVLELVNEGFDRDNISILAYDARGDYGRYVKGYREGEVEVTDAADLNDDAAAEGAGVGAGVGAAIGGLAGLLIGLGALTIPGVGPVVAAGPLAAALTGLAGAGAGAVAGGVTGGLIGTLVDAGVPEETAHYYAEGIRRGGTMVNVVADEETAHAAIDILNDYDPVNINERAANWEAEGWSGFDPQAEPYYDEEFARYQKEEFRRPGDAGYGSVEEMNDFTKLTPGFQSHFSGVYSDYNYSDYEPAYRYGYNLARDDRFNEYTSWPDMEPEARRYWNETNPGTWERFKDSIRHAWTETREKVS